MSKTTVTLDSAKLERLNSFRFSLSNKMGRDLSNGEVIDHLLDTIGWPRLSK
jgi:hypothetical protein